MQKATPPMCDLPPLYILRHGETEWNAAGRLQGRLDSPLTDQGRAQARAQGRILARNCPKLFDIHVSPAPRTVTTAELALPRHHSAFIPDPRLLEIDLGSWQGRSIGDVPNTARDDPHLWKFEAPGGESLTEMSARCAAVLEDLRGTRCPAVLVTHGITSRVLRCLALGRPVEDLSALPGGQGIVHLIRDGAAQILRP